MSYYNLVLFFFQDKNSREIHDHNTNQLIRNTDHQRRLKMRNLPEVEFITVKEDAYQRAEELASFGFAVAVYNDGHIFRIETQEDFQPCNTSPAVSFSL